MELSKKTLRNIFLVISGCIILYWLLHETERVRGAIRMVQQLTAPFAVGAALAFILNVPMRAIERKLQGIRKLGVRRALAILLTFVTLLLVLVGVVCLLVPQIDQTVESLVATLPDFFRRVETWLTEFLNDNPDLKTWIVENTELESLDLPSLVKNVITAVGNGITTVAQGAIAAVGNVTNAVVDAVIGLVFALYCLSRKEILARQCRRVIYSFLPEHVCDQIVRILRLTNSTFSNFISGQCLEAVILGCMFAVAMAIFQMPYIPLVSVLIAVTALVPMIGAFVGCVLSAFFIMVVSPIQALWFIGLFLVLQQIEGNVIYPRVVGTSIGLPGMWVLVAVSVGGDLMGIGGMLVMIPLTSVLYALMREITDKRLEKRGIANDKLQDHPPELKSNFKEKRQKAKQKRDMKKLLMGKKNPKK